MASPHPLVGSWRVTVQIPNANVTGVNLATYGSDGTVVVAFPSPVPALPGQGHQLEFYTPAIGSWVASGERAASQRFVTLGTDERGNPVGTHTVTAEVDVAADGETWSGPFRIELASVAGEVVGTVAGTVSATRIVAPAAGA